MSTRIGPTIERRLAEDRRLTIEILEEKYGQLSEQITASLAELTAKNSSLAPKEGRALFIAHWLHVEMRQLVYGRLCALTSEDPATGSRLVLRSLRDGRVTIPPPEKEEE